MGTPKFRGQRSNSPNVPNDQLPINASRSNLADGSTLPFIMPHARNSVLMHREQLGFPLRTSTATTDAGDTPGIRVLKRVKGRTVQPPRSTRTESGRTESGFRSRRIIQTANELPSTFVSGEDVRLAIMTGGDDSILGGPYEGNERERGHSDGTNDRPRPRIDDTDGAVVTCANIYSTSYPRK